MSEQPADTAPSTSVLRRGLEVNPEIGRGLRAGVAFAVFAAVGRLAIPILIQQVLDHGILAKHGFDGTFTYTACAIGAIATIGIAVLSRVTYVRVLRHAEAALADLRVKVFDHIHRLSIAEHTENRKGVFVSRVTSDIETLARFVQWGAMSWIVNGALIVLTLAVMLFYSWQLALIVVVVYSPVVPILRMLQQRQLAAYDETRTTTGELLSELSETVTGASVIRAYGIEERARERIDERTDAVYRAQMKAAKFFAMMFPLGDFFGALSIAAVTVVAAFFGLRFGLGVGEVIAFLFLVNLLLNPIAELSEILDQTQTALAGWNKVLSVLDIPIDVPEPDATSAHTLPRGALGVRLRGVDFAYRDGPVVLRDVDVTIAPGAHVAVVGETGSGKTTFAKLLCRLADPMAGAVEIGGVDLRTVAKTDRHRAVRMVPQDGFLFDTTIGENVALGGTAATEADVRESFVALGLDWWLDRLPQGVATLVGERGESLSVGERQLVALARAQLSDAGLLILDEATSAVDPETEHALADAMVRVGAGRTTISIAHRLSTAMLADVVLVFDQGRLVEQGSHDELVEAGGIYAGLYESWVRNTAVS